MNVAFCLCLLWCAGDFTVIFCQKTADPLSSKYLTFTSKNNNSLFAENNKIHKTSTFKNYKNDPNAENMFNSNSKQSSKLTARTLKTCLDEPEESLISKIFNHSRSQRKPRFAKSSSKETGLRQPKSLCYQLPLKTPRQTLDEIIRYNYLESPNKLGGSLSELSKNDFAIMQPKRDQNLVTQGKLSESVSSKNEVPNNFILETADNSLKFKWQNDGNRNYYQQHYSETQKKEDGFSKKFKNSALPMSTSIKNNQFSPVRVDLERDTVMQATENKINTFQSALNSHLATGKSITEQPTSKNPNNLEKFLKVTKKEPKQLGKIDEESPQHPPSILRLDTFNSLPEEDNPTQKLQRSSQFIPICPEVDNITEIYWELCKDFGCDEEFFDELKKKHWTEEVLRIKGLPAPPPKFFEPQPIISAPQSFITPESLAIPELESNSILKTPLDFAPKSQEFPRIQTNNPPRALSDNERVLYPTNVLSNAISTDQDNSINFLNTDAKIQTHASRGWNQQIPNKISSKDLSSLNSIVIPLEARTFTKSSSLPTGGSFPCLNYPFQNTEILSVLKVPQTPVMYPPSGFEHVLNNCNNIINRVPEATPEVVAEEVVEVGAPETEIEKPGKESESETEEEESDEDSVVGVETFPEFNQVVKTKILKAQMFEQGGNLIFLPESESDETEDEKSGSKSKEEKSVEVEVHVTKFDCARRNTPENKRMAKIDLKDLHKGETWPHLSYLKLIPLSESFEEELLAREEMEDIVELLKAAENNGTAGIPPVNKNQTEPAAAAEDTGKQAAQAKSTK